MLSSGLYLMYCAQEALDARAAQMDNRRQRTDAALVLGQPLLLGSGEGLAGAETGPDVKRAQQRVDSLRMLLTNRDDAASTAAISAAVTAAKEAMQICGLRDELAQRMRREKPSKYELVNQVLPGLFVGGWAALNNDCAALKKRGITHVLSVVSADQQRRLPKWIVGAKLVQCSDTETASLGRHFRDICAFVDEARRTGGSCYVHCGAGISRAPTAVTAYLMHSARLRLREAFALVKRHRPSARPNKGFVRQLQTWEATLFGSSTVDPSAVAAAAAAAGEAAAAKGSGLGGGGAAATREERGAPLSPGRGSAGAGAGTSAGGAAAAAAAAAARRTPPGSPARRLASPAAGSPSRASPAWSPAGSPRRALSPRA